MKIDRDACLAAMTQNGDSLQYAAEPMKAYKEVSLAAVTQDMDRFFELLRNPRR